MPIAGLTRLDLTFTRDTPHGSHKPCDAPSYFAKSKINFFWKSTICQDCYKRKQAVSLSTRGPPQGGLTSYSGHRLSIPHPSHAVTLHLFPPPCPPIKNLMLHFIVYSVQPIVYSLSRMTPLLSINNLSVRYSTPSGRLIAVRDVSLEINVGETVGLVGESGCGKSSIARAIMGLEPIASGTLTWRKSPDLRELTPAARKSGDLRHVGAPQMVFQDPFASLNPRMTVIDLITEAAVVHGVVSRAKQAEYAVSLLADVGLPADILNRYPHAFSGGQRQRLCIARALSLRPRLLICDEPVSALDVSVQAQVIDLLSSLQRQHALSMLFISHDVAVVGLLAQRIAVMKDGLIVETGETEQVLKNPQHPYTRRLLAAVL